MSPLLGCRHQHQNQHININLSISISITSVSTSAPANQCKPQCNGSNFEKHSPSPSNPKNPYCNKQSIQKRTRHKGTKAQIRIQRKTIGQGEILASKNNIISRNYQFYKWLQVHVKNMYNLCMKWQVPFEHESRAPICEWVIERGRVSLSPDPAFLITFEMIKSRIVVNQNGVTNACIESWFLIKMLLYILEIPFVCSPL